ncbi:GspH/FimT family pseudopilin [Roseateles sp. BYS87W]|uniref:Type II secretion system protein H n=1 Tax=Pelomonas baiyunensis TaxID=3299026 RepID=A0ABW7GTT5_9BURK
MLIRSAQRGFSLIETMVVVIIMGLLLAAAAPNFASWIAGSRIRATAEGILAGLQYARSEATSRNAQVRFQLTTSLTNTCTRSTTAANWVVDMVDAVGGAADSVENQCNAVPSDTVAPSILQVRSAAETGNVTVTSTASQIIFDGLGRQVPIPPAAASAVAIDLTPGANGGQCAATGGRVTCLRIEVSTAGLVRMCNPAAQAADPQSC